MRSNHEGALLFATTPRLVQGQGQGKMEMELEGWRVKKLLTYPLHRTSSRCSLPRQWPSYCCCTRLLRWLLLLRGRERPPVRFLRLRLRR